jgi:superfamily I DNA/RNA helicase
LETLKKNGIFRQKLKYALVDDAQDLTPEAFEILSLAARHITIFSDSWQKLNEEWTPESVLMEALQLDKGYPVLEGDFRSSTRVAHLAARFISDDDFRYAYLSQVRMAHGSHEEPLCYVAPSEEKELLHLSRTVGQKMVQKHRVGILVPTDRLVHSLAKSLLDKGIEAEKAISVDAQNVIHQPYSFHNNLPKITTYSMAKGLTFDSVLLPRLTENAFSPFSPSQRRQLLFEGISRASVWVYLSTVRGDEFGEMEILRSAQSDGHLRIVYKAGYE